ncbi:MAG TPA: NADP-dependent oxidoreductase, partial [Streptosporangiaceae bacterium]|nr:NADP-dependent oxidoreductase [Streptosporangiaceae bacterium]
PAAGHGPARHPAAQDAAVPDHADVIALRHRPGPALSPGDLVAERRPLRPPGPGEVVVRNVVTSVDPYQLRMLRGSPEVTPVAIGEPVPANSVGYVVRSLDPAVPVGAQVATYTGWQSYATTTVAPTEITDPALGGPLDWISVLSTTGVTAYVGMHDIGQVQAGQTVLVSAATGAVGGVAVQLAKAAGARVIAIAGGRQRTEHAAQVLGADAAVDYRDPAFGDQLKQAAGAGIDLFYDNVGGRQLTLALSVMRNYGNVVLCGSVSSYARPDDPDARADLRDAVFKRITLRGFIVSDHYPERLLPIRSELGALLRSGQVRAVVSEFKGLGSAPEALSSVFDHGSPYIGRRVVRIAAG